MCSSPTDRDTFHLTTMESTDLQMVVKSTPTPTPSSSSSRTKCTWEIKDFASQSSYSLTHEFHFPDDKQTVCMLYVIPKQTLGAWGKQVLYGCSVEGFTEESLPVTMRMSILDSKGDRWNEQGKQIVLVPCAR